jgi:hypothetical protein
MHEEHVQAGLQEVPDLPQADQKRTAHGQDFLVILTTLVE